MAGNINAAHRLTPPDISVGGLAKLASPIFVANLAVMGNATIDTIMAGRLGAEDLAAVALASASTGCIFMLLVGIVQGLSPICGHHFGARKFEQIGFEINQSLYLVLLLSIFGIGILSWTSFWTELGGVTGRIASLASLYLIASAVAVPAALLNRVFISVNAAINQPRITMWISLLMLALKAPVNALFMYGLFGLPELGGAGAGVGKQAQLRVVEMDAVGVPDVRADPPEGFHVFQGPHSAPLPDEALLVLRLAEVGMEPHAQISG